MDSTTYSTTLLHHMESLRDKFATEPNAQKREEVMLLMKEAFKIHTKIEKLIVAENLNNQKKQKALQELIDFAFGLLVLHINQTIQ